MVPSGTLIPVVPNVLPPTSLSFYLYFCLFSQFHRTAGTGLVPGPTILEYGWKPSSMGEPNGRTYVRVSSPAPPVV